MLSFVILINLREGKFFFAKTDRFNEYNERDF